MRKPRTSDTSPDRRPSAIARFCHEERGAVFLEFIIVIYAFLFLLLGIVQVGLMVCASFYTNYANSMALRTAAVWYEPFENGFISQSEFENKCKEGALAALAPMERFYWKNPNDFGARGRALDRIEFVYEETDDKTGGKANTLKGRLEYDYPLIVPFVGRVITGVLKSGVPQADRVGQNFAYDVEGAGARYPLLTLRTNNELDDSGAPPRSHETVIQRRWKFSTEQN